VARPCSLVAALKMVETNQVPVEFLDGLRQLANRYDGFILDQWGVLHDGRAAYPGAVECLLQLNALGKHAVILSNSGKRAYANEGRLSTLGFERGSYSQLITSGDVAWDALKTKADPFFRRLGHRCLLLSNDGDQSLVENLALELINEVEDADFILLAGLGELDKPSDYEFLLTSALALRLPMLCANPDLTRLVEGGVAFGCGAIALSYERLGGEVHYVGKPHREVYKYCRSFFEEHSVRRIVTIGDSLQHDVAGGNAAGFDTVFISGGIHGDCFASALDDNAKYARLVELIGAHTDRQPTWMLSSLRW
jgi:HAD superfamily hydrolase (TIGR01459 family)